MRLEFKVMTWFAGGLLGLLLLLGSFKVVSPGERGIYIFMGKSSDEIIGEGAHFKVPLFSTIKTLSIQVQKTQATAEAATKDLQRVRAEFALNWTIDPSKVPEIFRSIGDESSVAGNIIIPAVSETLKAATARMTAEEVLTKRIELKTTIDEMLIKRLAGYNLVVRDISLVDLDFTREFNHAVEAKQIAEQQAKQAEYVAVKATNDAKAAVNTARGVADSALIQARAQAESQKLLQSTVSQQILQLKAIEKWDGSMPNVMGSGGNMLFNIPVSGKVAAPAKTETAE